MFIELMPLIEKRAITITVAALKDGHVRVNVVPAGRANRCVASKRGRVGLDADRVEPIAQSIPNSVSCSRGKRKTPFMQSGLQTQIWM